MSGSRPPMCSEEVLAGVPDAAAERARWWEQHVIEVLTGRRAGADPGVRPRPEFDPWSRSLRQRELAKLAELEAAGHEVSLNTLQRQRFAYERDGLLGVVDRRHIPQRQVFGNVDERLVATIRQAIEGETETSTGTVSRLQRRVAKALVAEYGADDAPAMPSQRTFYRIVKRLSEGRHTFGSARTRRSLSKQPDGPFGALTVARPGEMVEIDSTPLDVRVVLDDGTTDRVELTGMVDNATRSIPSAVLRPTTKAVDAALLLARALTPEPMRPGWSDALRMSRSVLPHRHLTDIDQRLADAAARPVIAPETVVCDHGKAYLSQTFRQACATLGVNLQPAHPDTPTDKPKIERTLQSVATLFAQHVAGYVGSSVERRGSKVEQEAVWTIVELQALLDEWIVAVWQNRPHDGLRDPVTPGTPMTPNEKYAALVEVAGYVPVPLSAEDYIELLPSCWRTINSYGTGFAASIRAWSPKRVSGKCITTLTTCRGSGCAITMTTGGWPRRGRICGPVPCRSAIRCGSTRAPHWPNADRTRRPRPKSPVSLTICSTVPPTARYRRRGTAKTAGSRAGRGRLRRRRGHSLTSPNRPMTVTARGIRRTPRRRRPRR